MKHIFIVHSHITYIAALGVVSHERIPFKDVLLISDGYQVAGPLPVVKTIINKNAYSSKLIFSRLLISMRPTRFLYPIIDNFLEGDSFVAYISVFHLLKKLIVVHPKCSSFHFIEEGLSSYYSNFDLSYYAMENPYPWFYDKGIKGLKERLQIAMRCLSINKPKIESIPLFYNSYTGNPDRLFYGLSDYSFPSSNNKIVIPLSNIVKAYPHMPETMNISNGVIWIGDPDIEYIVGQEAFYKSLESFLPKFKTKNPLYVRFHYRETEEQRRKFVDFLNTNGIEYSIIDDGKIMEFLFLSSSHCKVLGVNSSLLIYASILGHNSYTLIKDFPSFKLEVERQIPVFFKLVSMVD